MAEIAVKSSTFYLDDELTKTFESAVGSTTGPVSPEGQRALLDLCLDDRGEVDYHMQLSVLTWLFVWREMTLPDVRSACAGIPYDELTRFSKASATLRQMHKPVPRLSAVA